MSDDREKEMSEALEAFYTMESDGTTRRRWAVAGAVAVILLWFAGTYMITKSINDFVYMMYNQTEIRP